MAGRPPPGGRRRPAPDPSQPPGRHFLRQAIAAEIVGSAGVRPGETVYDLGAGDGRLTAPLVLTGAQVIAIERDPRLAARLRRRVPAAAVLDVDLRSFRPPARPYRVVANPPFALLAELLGALLDGPGRGREPGLTAADLVVPHYAAMRALHASTSRWRRRHARFDLQVVRRLPPTAFVPPPSVPTVVVRIRRRGRPTGAAQVRRNGQEPWT